MINGEGIKTGLMSREEVLSKIKDVNIQVDVPASESGEKLKSARIPLELVKEERDIYIATVYVEATLPEEDDLQGSSINSRIFFKGDPLYSFMLSVSRIGKSGPLLVIGPDNRPECYEQ
jgi:hypothetical protein